MSTDVAINDIQRLLFLHPSLQGRQARGSEQRVEFIPSYPDEMLSLPGYTVVCKHPIQV
jgi:hypothetical protein